MARSMLCPGCGSRHAGHERSPGARSAVCAACFAKLEATGKLGDFQAGSTGPKATGRKPGRQKKAKVVVI